ncbi:LysR family transcriptional regulator [uncultured Vibrio sp.]|uniref:LysR family transcriptional regulator n=1 Tax=uncultured Vibrio sp. TaxID=114054 RepID=UPI0025D0AC33|nr:LysR family transcriptional regulator [uncultured Vibrio sp.]
MPRPFEQLDLNLLRSFLVIYQERNTTKAAEILNVSQSAVSRTLQRLRDHFGDELLMRTPNGLTPTPKADEIAKSLPAVMHQLASICSDRDQFDPANINDTVRLALIPLLITAIGAQLCESLRSEAPNIGIEMVSWEADTAELINANSVQVGVAFSIADLPKQLVSRKVASDGVKLVARHNHPLFSGEVSLERVAKYPFASVILPQVNYHQPAVATAMAEQGVNVDVNTRFIQFDALASYVEQTDSISPGSHLLERTYASKIKGLPITIPGMPKLDYCVVYHARNRQNPLYSWIQSHIKRVLDKAIL